MKRFVFHWIFLLVENQFLGKHWIIVILGAFLSINVLKCKNGEKPLSTFLLLEKSDNPSENWCGVLYMLLLSYSFWVGFQTKNSPGLKPAKTLKQNAVFWGGMLLMVPVRRVWVTDPRVWRLIRLQHCTAVYNVRYNITALESCHCSNHFLLMIAK